MPSMREHLDRIVEQYKVEPPMLSFLDKEAQSYKHLDPDALWLIAERPKHLYENICLYTTRVVSIKYQVHPLRAALQIIEAAIAKWGETACEEAMEYIPTRGQVVAFNLLAQHEAKKVQTDETVYVHLGRPVQRRIWHLLAYLVIKKLVTTACDISRRPLPNVRLITSWQHPDPQMNLFTYFWDLSAIFRNIVLFPGLIWIADVLRGANADLTTYPHFVLSPRNAFGSPPQEYDETLDEIFACLDRKSFGVTLASDGAGPDNDEVLPMPQSEQLIFFTANIPSRPSAPPRARPRHPKIRKMLEEILEESVVDSVTEQMGAAKIDESPPPSINETQAGDADEPAKTEELHGKERRKQKKREAKKAKKAAEKAAGEKGV